MDRLADRQQRAPSPTTRRSSAAATKQRAEATESLAVADRARRRPLRTGQGRASRRSSAAARALLSKLTAEEKARLAALEKQEGRRGPPQGGGEGQGGRSGQGARPSVCAEQEQAQRTRAGEADPRRPGRRPGPRPVQAPTPVRAPGPARAPRTARRPPRPRRSLAFARAQIGKPYVWGATGPSSYDCSGLTQAAWKAAGVELPRTTWDQVKAGTRVATADLTSGRPGLLLRRHQPRRHLHRRRHDDPRPASRARTSARSRSTTCRSTAASAPPDHRRTAELGSVARGAPSSAPRATAGRIRSGPAPRPAQARRPGPLRSRAGR